MPNLLKIKMLTSLEGYAQSESGYKVDEKENEAIGPS